MGNDHSHLHGVEIEEKSVEVSDFWAQHCATVLTSGKITNLTILIGELFVDGPLWSSKTPLEKSSKNLMIYRHPCIVKYISSWRKSAKFYLALEEVQPLSHILGKQNTLQICIGLHSILKSLCFLHERAGVSHNNVCTASVYVTKDGNWKLGGMEFLCRFSDLTSDYLRKSRINRYSKALDSKEEEHLQKCERRDFIDAYSFGVLVTEVLKERTNDEIPCLTIFYDLCKNELQHVDPSSRPKLSTLLEHEFFNHDFIILHSFLIELPVKSDEEKRTFFQDLLPKLQLFNEVIIASQLGGLLLSRMVLLNKVAQEELLPHMLTPKRGSSDSDEGLFSESTFRRYLSPKLLEIFAVRDAQIRLLLLNNFPKFMRTFTKDELQSHVLPELLVGIKDTNDVLVATTLRTLADVVPILGANTVIGGKRAKLFNDGRPITHPVRRHREIKRQSMTTQPTIVETVEVASPSHVINNSQIVNLPERPRPDGEEVETSTEEVEPSLEEDNDNWDDWDMNEANNANLTNNEEVLRVDLNENDSRISLLSVSEINAESAVNTVDSNNVRKKPIPDINELDIKNQSAPDLVDGNEVDFFQDMEPVIESSTKFAIEQKDSGDLLLSSFSGKLNLNMTDDNENEASWGDEEWD